MRKTTIAYIKAALRRTWGRSKQRQGALNAAKISYGLYRCAECKQTNKRKNIEVDHIVAIGRFTTFDLYIERLFCDTSGLRVLCKMCHKGKTKTDMKKMGN
jgi:5-methylcytosine-specific restriction endonuclease McrA